MAREFQVNTASGGTLTTSLQAYYKLENATEYYVGDGSLDLTNTASVPFVAAKVNNGADFERGSNQNLGITDNAVFSTGDIDFSFAFWVKFESLAAGEYHGVITKWAGSPNGEYAVYIDGADQKLYFTIHSGTTESFVKATTFGALSTATWYFVYVEHDAAGNTIGISINNGTLDTAAHSGGAQNGANPLYLGRDQSTSNNFDGILDEFGFWKKRLSSNERSDLYNGGSGQTMQEVTVFTVNVNDSVSISESLTVNVINNISIVDSLSITESISRTRISNISIVDSLSITESVTVRNSQLGGINLSDSISITESVTVRNSQLGGIDISDQLTITESVEMGVFFDLFIYDDVSIVDNLVSENSQLGNIDVSDSNTISEDISTEGQLGDINLYEDISVYEELSLGLSLTIDVSDIVSVLDVSSVAIYYPPSEFIVMRSTEQNYKLGMDSDEIL